MDANHEIKTTKRIKYRTWLPYSFERSRASESNDGKPLRMARMIAQPWVCIVVFCVERASHDRTSDVSRTSINFNQSVELFEEMRRTDKEITS